MKTRTILAAAGIIALAGLATACVPSDQYVEACKLEGGTPLSVPGSSPLMGYCEHQAGAATQAAVDYCQWIMTERYGVAGACFAVKDEGFHWYPGV